MMLMSKASTLNHHLIKPLNLLSHWCISSSSNPTIVSILSLSFHTRHRKIFVKDHIPMSRLFLFPLINVNEPLTPLLSKSLLTIVTDSKFVVLPRPDTVLTSLPNS